MLKFIGLGIHDEKDISIRGLEEARKCDLLYADGYTSRIPEKEKLEAMIGKEVKILTRGEVEETDTLLDQKKDIGFLVGGDPFCATTHIELFLRAMKKGIKIKTIHSSSILSAIAETGLQIYKFGRSTSVARPEKNFRPRSAYDAIAENKKSGLHTLVLLDIRSEEGYLMSAAEAVKILLGLEEEQGKGILTEDTELVAVADLGGESLKKYGKAKQLLEEEIGPKPHAIIVPGKLHFLEKEAIEFFR